MTERMNLMKAYEKTLASKGFIQELYDYITDHEIDVPFLSNSGIASSLDNYYYYSWSGDKLISPVVEKMLKQEQLPYLAPMFWNVFGAQLLRQWANFNREYDPIDDYDITEETTYEHTGDGSLRDTGDDVKQKWGKIESTNKVWGMNSTAGVDSDKTITDYGNSDSNGVQDKITYGKTRTTEESANDDLTIHKYGNLGINPISDFLKKDIELWKLNFYQNVFFPAIDNMLTLPIY